MRPNLKSPYFWLEVLKTPIEIPLHKDQTENRVMKMVEIALDTVKNGTNVRVYIDVEKDTIYVWRNPNWDGKRKRPRRRLKKVY